MTFFLTDVILIVLFLFFFYIGFRAGIIRSFFAVLAGFIAIVLAENYPHQIGINYYLIFCFCAAVVYLLGLFVLRLAGFIFLSFFDKLAGGVFGILLCLILSANFIIPHMLTNKKNHDTKIAAAVSGLSSKMFPAFGKYYFDFESHAKKLKEKHKYFLLKKE